MILRYRLQQIELGELGRSGAREAQIYRAQPRALVLRPGPPHPVVELPNARRQHRRELRCRHAETILQHERLQVGQDRRGEARLVPVREVRHDVLG